MTYSLDDGDTAILVTDFFRRVSADQVNIASSLAYDEYDIEEGETPEILADKVYNDSALHWVILITNEIIDPRFDWPLDSGVLYDYVVGKYGLANIYATHHYVNSNGDIVHSSYTNPKTAVTNFQYEEAVNEAKRRIKLVKPRYVADFVNNFENVITNGN